MYTLIAQLKSLGWISVAVNRSGIGAEVLQDPADGRVAKFGQDAGYDVFVSYARSQKNTKFPIFYSHALPEGPFQKESNKPFTYTVMEPLVALTTEEEAEVQAWIDGIGTTGRAGGDFFKVADPFNLTAVFLDLNQVARNAGTNLDLKPSNFMVRVTQGSREIVFTDPFNG